MSESLADSLSDEILFVLYVGFAFWIPLKSGTPDDKKQSET